MYFSLLSLNAHIFNIILCFFFENLLNFYRVIFLPEPFVIILTHIFWGLCFTFPFSLNHLLFIAVSSFLWLTF